MAAQLRAISSQIIVTADRHAPNSVEGELAELVRRTLELIDRVCTEPPAIEPDQVIDVEALEPKSQS